MAGFIPAIHVLERQARKTWMPGTRPGMTGESLCRNAIQGHLVSKPRVACLIGWPAAHSRSPLIHHYWLRTLGIAGGYVIEAVPPDEFKDFIFRLSLRGFVGANVTIPHKERALSLSKPDERARAVGAANTLWFADGELRSTNTDVEGFINNLDASAPGWDGCEDALVLGAGGSARAVVFGLLDRGIKRVHLANRTVGLSRDHVASNGKIRKMNVGLEKTFDSVLTGQRGQRLVRFIAGGVAVPVEGYQVEPEDGKDHGD